MMMRPTVVFALQCYICLLFQAVALESNRVIIVGGSSGMGKAAAREVLKDDGGKVLLVSRSKEKLENARDSLWQWLQNKRLSSSQEVVVEDDAILIEVCDITKEADVEDLSTRLRNQAFDGLVVTAAGKAAHGPVLTLSTSDTRDMLESKLWGAYYCAKHLSPLLVDGSAVVFCAGILNRRPGLNCAPLAMANGALEGLTRTLALEWGPRLRVNCLSPGFCDTERFDHMSESRKEAMMLNTAASLPLQKVGQPEDMGRAIYFLLNAEFCTGVILDVDGGHGIRQYARISNDPMRKM